MILTFKDREIFNKATDLFGACADTCNVKQNTDIGYSEMVFFTSLEDTDGEGEDSCSGCLIMNNIHQFEKELTGDSWTKQWEEYIAKNKK